MSCPRFLRFDTFVSEVSAHIAAATHYYPGCRAVLDVGGQDSKAMLFDDGMKIWVAKMSGICAAGTGAFLDSVAAKLNIPVEELAKHVNYDSALELSSVCAVLSATSVNKFKNRYPLGDYRGRGVPRPGPHGHLRRGRSVSQLPGRHHFSGRGGLESGRGPLPGGDYRQSHPHSGTQPGDGRPRCRADRPRLCRGTTAGSTLCRGRTGSVPFGPVKKAVALRTRLTRREFLSKSDAPLVWRNLFFPTEILNALGVRILTMETYAALHARNGTRLRAMFDRAARKGFSAETCSFLRVLEGDDRLPKPDFVVGTSEPCQQGERILGDLVRDLVAPIATISCTRPSSRTTDRWKRSPPGWKRRWPISSGRWG